MTADERRVAAIVGGLVALVALALLSGRVAEELRPEPRGAHVAIELPGEGLARVGDRAELAPGERFLLRAVLEAVDWRGGTIYYTEADRLQVDGVEIDPDRLRRWAGTAEARVLWFSVEGASRYREAAALEDLEAFEFREVYRPEWSQAWTIPGSVLPSFAAAESLVTGVTWPELGIQRYHVRVELFGPESRIRPRSRLQSPGAAVLPAQVEGFPTAVVAPEGPLAVPAALLGLTQIEPAGSAPHELRSRLVEWTDRGIAFSRLVLLQRHLASSGRSFDELDWIPAELDGSAPWIGEGHLIRAGSRVVVALEDRGERDRLDGDDLVLDYDRGAKPVRLGSIFRGEGLVERADLSPASAP